MIEMELMVLLYVILLFFVFDIAIRYLFSKRRSGSWRGGIFLVMEDDSMIPVNWNRGQMELHASSGVKGIFALGARRCAMPFVTFNLSCRTGQNHIIPDMESHRLVETRKGVYQYYGTPLTGYDLRSMVLIVIASDPWNGCHPKSAQGEYSNSIGIDFGHKEPAPQRCARFQRARI